MKTLKTLLMAAWLMVMALPVMGQITNTPVRVGALRTTNDFSGTNYVLLLIGPGTNALTYRVLVSDLARVIGTLTNTFTGPVVHSNKITSYLPASASAYGMYSIAPSLANNKVLLLGGVTGIGNGLVVQQNASSNMFILIDPGTSGYTMVQKGNLAVGAVTPTEKLHVDGNVLITGTNTAPRYAWTTQGRGVMVMSNLTETLDITETPVAVTNWTHGFQAREIGINHTNGTIVLTNAGTYEVTAQLSFGVTTQPADVFGEIYVDDTATGYRFNVDYPSANQAHQSCSCHGIVTVTAGQTISLRMSSAANETIEIKCGQIKVVQLPD